MFKLYTVVFIFIIIANSSFSQTGFSNKYLYPLKTMQMIDGSTATGYFICGRTSYNNILIGKVDSLGIPVWIKKIDIPGQSLIPYDMLCTDTGNLVVISSRDSGTASSQRTILFSFDTSGNLVFSKQFINSNGVNSSNIPCNIIKDGSDLIFTTLNNLKTSIIKIDQTGNIIDSKYIIGNFYNGIAKIDNGYLLFSMGDEITRFDTSMNYLGTKFAGSLEWYNVNGIIQLSSGSLLLYGGSDAFGYLQKVDEQGNFQWTNEYDISSSTGSCLGFFHSAYQTGINSILLYAQPENCSINTKPVIVEIDTLGNVLNAKLLTISGTSEAYGIQTRNVYSNGVFTFLTNTKNFPWPWGDRFYISQTDTSFTQLCEIIDTTLTTYSVPFELEVMESFAWGSSTDSLSDISLTITNENLIYGLCSDTTLGLFSDNSTWNKLEINPNPAVEKIYINVKGKGLLNISTVIGEILMTIPYETHGSKGISIDVSMLKTGMYFVTDDKNTSQKLMIVDN
jgi:hypothetical protein